jgi:hypothetical protein
MNCETSQRSLLAADRPDRPPAAVQAHLARCPRCRQWQRRLLQLERQVPLLPVPATTAKADLIWRLLTDSPGPSVPRAPTLEPKQWLWAAAGLAAVFVLLVNSWSVLLRPPDRPAAVAPKPPAAPDTMLAHLLQRSLRLAEATSARQRVEGVAGLAELLHGESGTLGRLAEADDVEALARLYERVIQEGVVARAQALPAAELRDVLEPIAGRLAQAGREADGLAREVPAASAGWVQSLAAVSRKGEEQLRALMGLPPLPALHSRAGAAHPGRRPFGVVPLSVALLGASTLTTEGGPRLLDERVRQWRQDRELIRVLVEGGLRLAGQEDPLQRADCCTGLAEHLAEAIQQAAAARDADRVAEMGQHFFALLKRGVAGNLSAARTATPAGSRREEELRRVSDRATRISQPVEDRLRQVTDPADPDDMQRALKAVHDGRVEVERALRANPDTR